MTQANDYQKDILNTLDNLLHKNDYVGAEKFLLSQLNVSVIVRDTSTQVLLRNELMGLYRKLGKKEEALQMVEGALNIVEGTTLEKQVGAGTTFLNVATVYKAFGMPERSIYYFEKARKILEKSLKKDNELLGGLYNNMALTLVDLKRFDEAKELNQKAIAIMKNKPLEVAITYLNMANAVEAQKGILDSHEEIQELLEKAKRILDGYENKDGYYAFVCEKCASVYGYFGDFLYDEELQSRARRIYEGN